MDWCSGKEAYGIVEYFPKPWRTRKNMVFAIKCLSKRRH